MQVHPTAIVAGAALAPDCVIGPYVVLEPGVAIGARSVLHSHVTIMGPATIGADCEVFPGAVIAKAPRPTKALARPVIIRAGVKIGNGCSIGPHSVIYSDVAIGDDSLVGDGASIREQSVIGACCVIGRYVTVNYNCRIGDRTKVMDHSWLAGNMTIGSGVFISGGVLTTNDNRPTPFSYSDATVIGQVIEDGVVIGAGATLLPNLRIGRGAVIAAGSIVTRDVDPVTLVMGPAARVKGTIDDAG